MTLEEVEAACVPHHLSIFGTFQTKPEDNLGPGSMILLGPAEPGFWAHFTSAPELQDDRPDPLDRWSHRVISELARALNGQAHFPFGAPTHPFMSWALRSGRAWASPVHLLVHDTAGLMVSYRGAIHLPLLLEGPAHQNSPCDTCHERPCQTACPVAALTPDGYDVPSCHAYLDTPPGTTCMTKGCAVRRSCPISATYGRIEAQSAFHMERFHR